jgi:hypothetical protein
MVDESPLPFTVVQNELLPALRDAVNPFATADPKKRPLPWLTLWVKAHPQYFK